MKEFESNKFYVWGIEGHYPEIGNFIRYFITDKIPADGMSNMNPDAHVGWFEATESTEYDNANVVYHNIPAKIFGEVLLAYQNYLGMPVFFWNDDNALSDEQRNELLGIGARFCRDDEKETRWFAEKDCFVYKLGEHKAKTE